MTREKAIEAKPTPYELKLNRLKEIYEEDLLTEFGETTAATMSADFLRNCSEKQLDEELRELGMTHTVLEDWEWF